MRDKQIIDEERMFECVWCKYSFKESDANFILSENPNECICSGCITEWADNLLCDLKRKEQECEKYEQLFDELDKRVSNCIKIYDCIIVSKIVKDIISKAKGEIMKIT